MVRGEKVYCIKSNSITNSGMNESKFKSGKIYRIDDIEQYISSSIEDGSSEVFLHINNIWFSANKGNNTSIRFDEYFVTLKEMRKLKIEQIENIPNK